MCCNLLLQGFEYYNQAKLLPANVEAVCLEVARPKSKLILGHLKKISGLSSVARKKLGAGGGFFFVTFHMANPKVDKKRVCQATSLIAHFKDF